MSKVAWVVGIVGVVGATAGVAYALSGDDTPNRPRGPYRKQVVPPQTPAEVEAVRQMMCTCYRGGATTESALVACALKQVYADVPFPSAPGDDPSLAEVEKRFGVMARELVELPSAAARDAWCGTEGPDPTPDPTPDPEVVDPEVVDPVQPQDPKARIRELAEGLLSNVSVPGSLFVVAQGHGGLEKAAREAFAAVGIMQPGYQQLVLPLMKAMAAGKRYNRKLYGRAKSTDPNKNEYWAFDGQVINPAWLPRNVDARAALLTGKKPTRNIDNKGNKTGSGSSYGVVWVPKFDVGLAEQGVFDVANADLDPTPELLDLLGM